MLKAFYYFPTTYKNQYITPETLKKIQGKRLQYIVDFAYRNTALYKEKFKKAGITPHDIATLDDITKIPFTTKDEIKAVYPHGIVTPGYTEQNCAVERTSGASGNMLTVLYDSDMADHFMAVAYRDYLAQGVRPWHKLCFITRNPQKYEKASKRSFLYHTLNLLGGRPEKELVTLARMYNPDVIGGHPHTIVTMAKVIEETGVKVNPRLILLGGEVAYPSVRAYIEKAFHGETFNKYGAFEMGSIAWECQYHTMHIDADSVVLEVVKDGEPTVGERGEIVGTNLWNKAMPFIRYKLNDVGLLSDEVCACGRVFPVIKDLEGRCDDFIVLPTGELLSPLRVVPFLFSLPEIEQFAIVQDRKDHIVIKVVPNSRFTKDIKDSILTHYHNTFGESVVIEIEKVNHIKEVGSKFKRIHRTYAVDLPF